MIGMTLEIVNRSLDDGDVLGCRFVLTPLGNARQQDGVLTTAHADPLVLLNVMKIIKFY